MRRFATHALLLASALAVVVASPSAGRAQDWTAMINERMNSTNQMLAQGQQQIEGMVQQRMQDPAVQASYRQHLAQAAASGQAPADFHTFTYNYIYTNGFSAQGLAHARATERAHAGAAPTDAERARDAAVPLSTLAGFYRNKGDRDGACRVLREAVASWTAIEERWRITEMDRRNDLEPAREQLTACAP